MKNPYCKVSTTSLKSEVKVDKAKFYTNVSLIICSEIRFFSAFTFKIGCTGFQMMRNSSGNNLLVIPSAPRESMKSV